MTSLRIGALRDRLTLERPTRTADGGGGASIAWEQLGELWASVQPVHGR